MYRYFFKRLIDILVSLIALPFVFLTIIIFGPIIYFTDKGPIFYCGKRIGKNDKPFKMVKFRSMKVNAPDIRLEDGSTYNGEDDPRVTKIGKFLRKTSIDELPQFLNVFVGQMSIIGPRPDPLDWLDKYPEDIRVFLKVRPGITGYSSAYFRNSVDGYEKMKNDAYYATHLSFWFDIKIFFKTIATVFKHENTYKDACSEKVVREYGYEYDAEINKELYDKTYGKCATEKYQDAYALRSGRDSIKAIAREYEPCIALLPALSCDSMVLPFKMYGHQVIYYKLKEDLSIDLDNLQSVIQKNSRQTILFLYMDYFGIESISKKELTNLQKLFNNVIFINDITHIFLSYDFKSSFKADYVLASIRKWINVPDGGLLWCKNELTNQELIEDTSFAYKRLEAQQLRRKFFETGDLSLKEQYRTIFSTVSDIIDNEKNPSRMSSYSFEFLKTIDFKQIKSTRKNNAKELIGVLKKCPKIRLLQTDTNKSNLYVPFAVNDRDLKQGELNKLGIFNTIIWPITKEQKEACDTAKYVEEHMLAAPCDQRYTVADMFFIGKDIVRIVNE